MALISQQDFFFAFDYRIKGEKIRTPLFKLAQFFSSQEQRRHIFANSVDYATVKKLVTNVFVPCKCRRLQQHLGCEEITEGKTRTKDAYQDIDANDKDSNKNDADIGVSPDKTAKGTSNCVMDDSSAAFGNTSCDHDSTSVDTRTNDDRLPNPTSSTATSSSLAPTTPTTIPPADDSPDAIPDGMFDEEMEEEMSDSTPKVPGSSDCTVGQIQVILRHQKFTFPRAREWAKWASKQTSERSGGREQSEQLIADDI